MPRSSASLWSWAGAVLLAVVVATTRASNVPAILVTRDGGDLPARSASAVREISAQEFRDDYVKPLTTRGPTFLLTQDLLSAEDLGAFDDAAESSFRGLKDFVGQHPSLYLPAIETSKESVVDGSKDLTIHDVAKDYVSRLGDIALTPNTVVRIRLPDTAKSSDRKASLRTNDKLVTEILKFIADSTKRFSVIYTGDNPSWMHNQENEMRIARQILQIDDPLENDVPGIFFMDNFTIFHALNITYVLATEGNVTVNQKILLSNPTESSTETVNNSIKFSFTMKGDGENLTSIVISFTFVSSGTTWSVSSLEVDVKSRSVKGIQKLSTGDIWAPTGMSFVCQNIGTLYNEDQNANTLGLEFEKLQIQANFNYTGKRMFGDGFDCVGFFTIPIWMSIFVTIVLLMILTFGITMLLDINTMDRFDDPKGKSITVPLMD